MKRKLQKFMIDIVGVEVFLFEKKHEAVIRFFGRELENYERKLKKLMARLTRLLKEVERNGKLFS